MLRYLTVPVTAFQQNCSIVWCDETRAAAIIDPGGELPRLRDEVQRLGVTLEAIWLTHAHIDHAGATGTLAREDKLPIIGPHEADQFWIDALPQQSRMFGFPSAEAFAPTRWLLDGDTYAHGYDHGVEPFSVWGIVRATLERGGPDEPEMGEDIDLEGFGFRIWAGGQS